jgi:hypothetical protein
MWVVGGTGGWDGEDFDRRHKRVMQLGLILDAMHFRSDTKAVRAYDPGAPAAVVVCTGDLCLSRSDGPCLTPT